MFTKQQLEQHQQQIERENKIEHERKLDDNDKLKTLTAKQLKGRKRETKLSLIIHERKLEGFKVNHILHLLLSLVTFGFWVLIWIFITIVNNSDKIKTEKLINGDNMLLANINDLLDGIDE